MTFHFMARSAKKNKLHNQQFIMQWLTKIQKYFLVNF